MAEIETYFIDNDNLLIIRGVSDAANGIFMNGASLTVTLLDSTGAEVPGQTWPASLSYVSESNGDYSLTLEYDLSVSVQQNLTAWVQGDSGPGLRLSVRVPVVTKIREGE